MSGTAMETPPTVTRAELTWITPFFIVRNVMPAIAFYRDKLGFQVTYMGPEGDPFYAMVERDRIGIMLKAITSEVQAQPNPSRHPWAAWDAYIHTPEPDRLAEEFISRGVALHKPLEVNSDNLRGFEVKDVDGYVLYFGRPEK